MKTPTMIQALDPLMRYHLTGCRHSARHAAYLFDRLIKQLDLDRDTPCLHGRMSVVLEAVRAPRGETDHV